VASYTTQHGEVGMIICITVTHLGPVLSHSICEICN